MNKDQAVDWLKHFIAHIDTQDNRGTAKPIFYLLQTPTVIWGESLSHADVTKYALCEFDYYDYDSKEELISSMKENGFSDDEIKEHKHKIVSIEGETIWETQETFFTKHGLDRHLDLNKHNYRKGHRDYVVHAFRNPEIKELFEAIRAIINPHDKV